MLGNLFWFDFYVDTLCHWQGKNLNHPMLITTLCRLDPKINRNLVIGLGPKAWLSASVQENYWPSNSKCKILLHCATLVYLILSVTHSLHYFVKFRFWGITSNIKIRMATQHWMVKLKGCLYHVLVTFARFQLSNFGTNLKAE